MYDGYYPSGGHVAVAPLPTLCEISYQREDWLPEQGWRDTVPAIPYRHKFPSQDLGSSPSCQDKRGSVGMSVDMARDLGLMAGSSPSFYRHSMYSRTAVASGNMCEHMTTVGCRTPMSYASPYRSGTTLSAYPGPYGGTTSHAVTLPAYNLPSDPGIYPYDGGAPGWLGEGGAGGRSKSARAISAPHATTLPQLPGHRSHSHAATLPPHHDGDATYRRYLLQGGDEEEEGRLTWIPALNTWVSDKSQKGGSYVTFVNSMNLINRGLGQDGRPLEEDLPILPCSRFLSHMHMHDEALHSLHQQREARLNQLKSRRDRYEAQLLRQKANSNNKAKSSPHLLQDLNKGKVRFGSHSKSPPHSVPSLHGETDSGCPDGSGSDLGSREGVYGDGSLDGSTENQVLDDEDVDGDDEEDAEKQSRDQETQSFVPDPSLTDKVKKEPTRIKKSSKPPKPPGKPKPKITLARRPKPAKTDGKKKKAAKSESKERLSRVDMREPPDLELTVKSEPEDTREPSPIPPPRTQVEKRVRWRAQHKAKTRPDSGDSTEDGSGGKRRGADWIFDGEDFSTEIQKHESTPSASPTRVSPPPLSSPPPAEPEDVQQEKKGKRRSAKGLPDYARQRWGMKKLDKSLEDERRRLELAEERRRKAQLMFEKLKNRKYREGEDDIDPNGPRFEDYGWLAKYCIFNRESLMMYQRTFEAVDVSGMGWLSPIDTMVGLRATNRALTDPEELYLYRILEMTGYSVTKGADFKLFAVMAALSQRISALDEWMKNLIGRLDMQMLDHKAFMCKTLWECNVDTETQKIPIPQLCVELRAGGVSLEHEAEVREKLGPLHALDLLDFLTYIPLFIMIHESVVGNPLDDTRDK